MLFCPLEQSHYFSEFCKDTHCKSINLECLLTWYQDNKILCLSLWLLLVKSRSLDSLLSSVLLSFAFVYKKCEMWPQLNGKNFTLTFSYFQTLSKGEDSKVPLLCSNILPSKKEVLHKEACFYAFSLRSRERRSILLPNVILWGWSFCFLSHSWPVAHCKLDMSLDPALTLHWQLKKRSPTTLGLAWDAVALLSPTLSPARGSSLLQLLLSPFVAH